MPRKEKTGSKRAVTKKTARGLTVGVSTRFFSVFTKQHEASYDLGSTVWFGQCLCTSGAAANAASRKRQVTKAHNSLCALLFFINVSMRPSLFTITPVDMIVPQGIFMSMAVKSNMQGKAAGAVPGSRFYIKNVNRFADQRFPCRSKIAGNIHDTL